MTNQQNTPSGDNTVKNPEDWSTGNEPATQAQLQFLQSLGHTESGQNLTKAEASKLIDSLRQQQPSNNTNQNIKNPEDWNTGDQPATGAQKSYLNTLANEAGEEIDPNVTKAEASEKIETLQKKTGRDQF